MISLKAFLPTLADFTGLSVTALYERQRALVRLGLLPAPTKRGPNSGGAMATPGTVAVMLISVLVTDSLSEMDDRILKFLSLRCRDVGIGENPRQKDVPCHFTGERTLYRAVRAALADGDISATLGLEVLRKEMIARIVDHSDPNLDSVFGLKTSPTNIEHVVSFWNLFSLSCELDATDPSKIISENALPAAPSIPVRKAV